MTCSEHVTEGKEAGMLKNLFKETRFYFESRDCTLHLAKDTAYISDIRIWSAKNLTKGLSVI